MSPFLVREEPFRRTDIWGCLDGCGVSEDTRNLPETAAAHTRETGHRTMVSRSSVRSFAPVTLGSPGKGKGD